MGRRITSEQQAVMDSISHTIAMLSEAPLNTMKEQLDAFDYAKAEEVYKKLNLSFWNVHKEWLLPLKHFIMLCKKMSSE